MSRYFKEVISRRTPEEILNIANSFLLSKGFKLENYKGGPEVVYHKGNGWVSAPQYIKFSVANGRVYIEGWLRHTILPHVYVGEFTFDDNSIFAALPKSAMKKTVTELEALLY